MAIIDTRIKFINAGFDYPNPEAEVVIVGITPGKNQLENGYKSRDVIVASREESLERKKTYAFKGLRENISGMLDSVDLNKLLGIDKCETIWNEDFGKVDFTSLIKEAAYEYENKNGKINPFNDADKIVKSIKLSKRLEEGFVEDCKQYTKAKLFVACGHKVYNVLCGLRDKGIISVPVIAIAHPSKNNNIRVQFYQGNEEDSVRECQKDAEEAKTIINDLLKS